MACFIQERNTIGRIDLDDDCYSTVKDSKHKLSDSNSYVALHYTGPDIFLIKWARKLVEQVLVVLWCVLIV